MTGIEIRYAKTDADVVAIHAFLCVVAGPILPGAIDPKDSATEVWRVARDDIALMAIKDGKLIGTIGLIFPSHWWNNKIHFAANRWLFTIPETNCLLPLMRNAVGIAVSSGLELHIYDEQKQRLVIFNRNPKRQAALAKAPKSSSAFAT